MAGETTSVAASAARLHQSNPGAGMFWVEFNLTYSTTQNELADVMEAGYIPAGAKCVAVYHGPTDMDSNGSPTLVHKVTVNGVDAVTGLTGAQSGTASLTPVTSTFAATAPLATGPQLVTVTSSTAAATAVAGTVVLRLLCQQQ